MGSGWKIGSIELPSPPNQVAYKMPHSIQKVPVGLQRPLLFSFGGDTLQLSLEGEIIEGNKSLSTLWSDYVDTIRDYIITNMIHDQVMLDESPTDYWTGYNTANLKATGDEYIMGEESMYVEMSDNSAVYREFDNNMDFEDYSIFNLWVKGTDSDRTFKLTMYNETWSGRTNGYRGYFTSSTTNWDRVVISPSSQDNDTYFNGAVGTPEGWDGIRTAVIEPSGGFSASGDAFRFDRGVIGIGWEVETPNNFYDGIYMIKDFQVEEAGGNIRSFMYRTNLFDKTDYFGEK